MIEDKDNVSWQCKATYTAQHTTVYLYTSFNLAALFFVSSFAFLFPDPSRRLGIYIGMYTLQPRLQEGSNVYASLVLKQ